MSTLTSKLPKKTHRPMSHNVKKPALEFVRQGLTVSAYDLTVEEWYEIIEDALGAFKPHLKYFYYQEKGNCLQLSFLPVHNFMLEPAPIIVKFNGFHVSCVEMRQMIALTRLSVEDDILRASVTERHLLLSRDCEMIELTRKVTKVEHIVPCGFDLPTSNGEAITTYNLRIFFKGDLLAELAKPSVVPLGLCILGGLRQQALIAIRTKRMAADDIEKKVNKVLEMENRVTSD